MATAAEKLAARIASIRTPQLVSLHGMTLALMYRAADRAPKAEKGTAAEPYQITVDAIATELVRRGVEMTLCCWCPVGHHDERICDRTAPEQLVRAADAITEAAMAVAASRPAV